MAGFWTDRPIPHFARSRGRVSSQVSRQAHQSAQECRSASSSPQPSDTHPCGQQQPGCRGRSCESRTAHLCRRGSVQFVRVFATRRACGPFAFDSWGPLQQALRIGRIRRRPIGPSLSRANLLESATLGVDRIAPNAPAGWASREQRRAFRLALVKRVVARRREKRRGEGFAFFPDLGHA